jgi:hypothetical protein
MITCTIQRYDKDVLVDGMNTLSGEPLVFVCMFMAVIMKLKVA